MNVSASELTEFLRCPASHRWKYVKRIEAPKFSEGLLQSILIHEALAWHYRGSAEVHENVRKRFDALVAEWEELEGRVNTTAPPQSALDYALAAYEAYTDYYEGRDYQSPHTIEQPGSLDINGHTLNYTIDMCASVGGLDVLVDHKAVSPQYFSPTTWRFDLQTTAYAYVCWKVFGWRLPITVHINAIVKYKDIRKDLHKSFQRLAYPRTESDMRRFETQFSLLCSQVADAVNTNDDDFDAKFPYSWGVQCNRYGPCQYLDLCAQHTWQPALSGFVTIKPRYAP